MTKFENGPAAGVTLMLRRAPVFLRVTQRGGKFDALDQLDDRPHEREKLTAYALKERPGWASIRASNGGGGFFPVATYEVIEAAPDDATMRDETAWRAWCEAHGPQWKESHV